MLKVHLWLGLASGLIVFVLGVSGCILTFEEEIRWISNSFWEERTVERQDKSTLSPGTLFHRAQEQLPAGGTSLVIYAKSTANTPVQLWHFVPGKNSDAQSEWIAYALNPYTGQILDKEDWNESFWGWMFRLHTSLLLPHEVGEPLVGYATLIFVILLITGLILWFPKHKKAYRRAFTLRFGVNPKRLNYDLHNVLGFYMSWIAVFIAISGLIFSFEWFKNSFIYVVGGGEELHFERLRSTPIEDWKEFSFVKQESIIDKAITHALSHYEHYDWYTVNYPFDSAATIFVNVRTKEGTDYDRKEGYTYDRYTGELLSTTLWADQSVGERIIYLNRAIHLGQIGGLPTKILAFLASLIASSLPITGFYIWWSRKRKFKQRSRRTKQVEINKQIEQFL